MFVGIICLAIAPLAWADAALDAALALIPDDGDVAIHYDDAGRAALEAAIGALEDAVGVTASFDATERRRVHALNIPVEQKDLVNKLSQAYYTLGDVFLHGQTTERRRRSTRGSCGD